jgi:hypothetical protein
MGPWARCSAYGMSVGFTHECGAALLSGLPVTWDASLVKVHLTNNARFRNTPYRTFSSIQMLPEASARLIESSCFAIDSPTGGI